MRSPLFRFASVAVNGEVEQDNPHYTENGHSTYPWTMGDHGLQEGTKEIKRMEKREGEGTVTSIEEDRVTISQLETGHVASYLNCGINSCPYL